MTISRLTIARYVVVGLISLVIGLVAFLPARVAAGWIQANTPLRLGGVTGTLLSGRAGYVEAPAGALDNLSWTLHPLDLLLGRASAAVHIDSDLGGFSGTVSRSLLGANHIDGLTGDASTGWLARRAGAAFLPLSGRLSIAIGHASFDDRLRVSALRGRIRLSDASWQLLKPPLKLGRFTTALTHTEQGVKATITDSHGALAIDGDLIVTNARRYRLDVRLRARAGADKRLKQQLKQLGPADDAGWHRVRESGRFY